MQESLVLFCFAMVYAFRGRGVWGARRVDLCVMLGQAVVHQNRKRDGLSLVSSLAAEIKRNDTRQLR
jgi:hypothetical protein